MTHSRHDRPLDPEVLGRIPLLSGLPPEELRELSGHMRVRHIARGEYVVRNGSVGDALMFLLAGSLQVVNTTEDGREIGINLIAPGSFFGELALIDGQPRSATVIAIEPAVVASLPDTYARRLIYGNPLVAERVLKHFATAIRKQTTHRELLAIPQAHRRIYALLCQLATPARDGGKVITPLPTQQQIAVMINTSRETVSRVLGELEQRGMLKKGHKTLYIMNCRRLEELARGQAQEAAHPSG